MLKLYISSADEKQSHSTLNQIISLLSQSSHNSPDLNKVVKNVIFKCRVENGPISISCPSLLSDSSSLATEIWMDLIWRSFSTSTERLILVLISDTKKQMKGKGCSIRNTPFLEHHMSYSLTGHQKVKFAVCAYKHNENFKGTETESFQGVVDTEICLWAFIGKLLDGNTDRLSNWKVNGNSISGTNNSIWIGPQYDFQVHRQSSMSISGQNEQSIVSEASPQPFLERNKKVFFKDSQHKSILYRKKLKNIKEVKMNKRTNKDYQRIWFDFHIDSIQRLDNLVLETDSNRPEIVKRALRMYEFVLNEQKNGKEFIIKDTKNNSQTLIAPVAI